MLHSATLNVMIKAAHRAARSLKRDLGEVDQLQVSLKGPRNFVTAADRRADAVVACGLPHYGRGDLALARSEIAAAQRAFAGLRRYGAATLDLAWIAAGRLDAYWERDLSPWDLAAGSLLVREAGGFISDLDGGDAILTKGNVVAGNETMHRELLRLLKDAAKNYDREAAAAPSP